MNVRNGTLDASLFGRAEARIREVATLPEQYIGDSNGAARALKALLNRDCKGFQTTVDPRTIVLLCRAVKKAMKYAAPPSDNGLPAFVMMFLVRLKKGGGGSEAQRLESADFCGYIACTNIQYVKV